VIADPPPPAAPPPTSPGAAAVHKEPPQTLTLALEFERGLAAHETERRALLGYRAGDLGARVTAFYLADLADRSAHHELGYASLDQYARQRMRMAPATLHEYVSVGRMLADLPEIDRMFALDQVVWSQVRALVRVATPQTERAWGEWAQGRTVREVRRQAARRDKGQLPTDPERRRIHTTKLAVRGRLNPVQLAVWNEARAALERSFGGPVSDEDLLMWIAHRVVRDLQDQPLTLRPSRTDLDPRNQDPPLPLEQRDAPTGSTLRREVLERDGRRCVCCSSKVNLSAHHVMWRRYGGATTAENLVTLCEGCHSLVHDRFLILRGEVDSLEVLDSEGCGLGQRLPPLQVQLGQREANSDSIRIESRLASFRDVPAEVDAAWWRRHRHLFAWNERAGVLDFEPGPAAPEPASQSGQTRAGQATHESGGLDCLVGQDRVKANLRVAIRAAQARSEPLGHVLLAGPPGLGKTSLAHAVAHELGHEMVRVTAPVVRDPSVLIRALTALPARSVLFLDEVHRLPPRTSEVLYDALEGGLLDLPVRCGWEQRVLRIRLEPFTLVAATTEEDKLPEPLRGRFVHRMRLEFYDHRELGKLLALAAARDGLKLTPPARDLLARASRDTPREGLALLQLVRDEAGAAGVSKVGARVVSAALARAGTTSFGVTAAEVDYLRVLAQAGKPLGLSTLAAKLGTTRQTIQRVYEPFLLRRDLIRLTPSGRCLAA
jgi:holliday junction DNA helicase RuvB